ncbi:hypothetical protein ASPBRDRAFT_670191 [Aspergillus brasiliensis CBS 101740]|uniref:Protein kinase domain-containing protein n=1 Tax=Aspergillus brasiliensis (strain CBS 101740 / IMI 381727 / IBT 21946) TaxID=767769 RepID=A0A1L9UN59_ASPBC|nr:hypothetical protein ASPBRDRAFT_670191 [Aspergillus brasiliensis CBS 101740]
MSRVEAEARIQAEERHRKLIESNRNTTFLEFIRHCHESLSKSIIVGPESQGTEGLSHEPTGMVCPDRFEHWAEFTRKQDDIYRSVCKFLEPTDNDNKRLFDPILGIEATGRLVEMNEMTCETDLQFHERLAVEHNVITIITELSKIPSAREYFCLGSKKINIVSELASLKSSSTALCKKRDIPPFFTSRHDSFCLLYNPESRRAVLSGEYRPPHELSMKTLRKGLRTHNFYEEIINNPLIPAKGSHRVGYTTARVAGSAVVQEYDTMILLGLEYGFVSTGLGLVFLRVPYDDPGTLQFHICEPSLEVEQGGDGSFLRPTTTIARMLCLTLMGFRSKPRSADWSAQIKTTLKTWVSSFDSTVIGKEEEAPDRDDPSEKSVASPRDRKDAESTETKGTPHSQARGSESSNINNREDPQDSGPDSAPGQKRRFEDTTSSASPAPEQCSKLYRSTQKCLLGLRRRGKLDKNCPNFRLHQVNGSTHHLTNTRGLAKLLKASIDECLDLAEPIGNCGLSGAPFKLTCARYGYTVIGKGTTCYLWPLLEREADVYQMLESVQGSSVPVYIGKINLRKMYFLLGAGKIRHMLLLGWGGETINKVEIEEDTRQWNISKSEKDIQSFGVQHEDLEARNILWNTELSRAMIIDFHLCTFDFNLVRKKPNIWVILSHWTD